MKKSMQEQIKELENERVGIQFDKIFTKAIEWEDWKDELRERKILKEMRNE